MNFAVGRVQGSKGAFLTGKATAFLRRTIRDGRGRGVIGTSTTLSLFENNAHSRYYSYQTRVQNKNNPFNASSGQKMKITTAMAQKNTEGSQQRLRRYQVFLAVGSNQGDSFSNIVTGIQLLCDPSFSNSSYRPTDFARSSFLYLTKPMYVMDQASFWNGAVELDTDHDPTSLLRRLKLVEEHLGRDFEQIRNGPRPLDLDILLCYDKNNSDEQPRDSTSTPVIVETSDLVIPHCRLEEREFVLAPLIDIAGRDLVHPKAIIESTSTSENANLATLGDLLDNLIVSKPNDDADQPSTKRLIPLPRGRSLLFDQTIIMGILNVTPDSFSDGGKWTDSVDKAVARALEMVDEGATIVDIGGESTRPGAEEVDIEEQIARTVPIVKAIRKKSKDIVLSIDTRHAGVARAAVEAGADIVNDVSGGTHDPDMLPTVANLQVPIVLMHMRGDPKSMQNLTNYEDQGGVVDGVVKALLERSQAAEEAGIPRWMQILDPGIGFAKDMEGNLSLLKNYADLRTKLGDYPLLLGTSRKGFIGKLSGETIAEERDFGSVGSCVAALCLGINGKETSLGCNILRIHNVKGAKQATVVMDAIVGAPS
jgi:dihydropteroate synthase/2-amino-4-hydroxy-6-hydroxymethyldihydropteridine diphosphokinase